MPHSDTAIRTTYLSIIGNLCLALLKGISGVIGNSNALIADAIESTTDVVGSLLVLFGLKYAARPADKNHPYGHGKIEPIVTFGVVTFLVVSASFILFESIHNILDPEKHMPQAWTLYVLGAIILWKEGSYRYVIKKSKQTHSTALKAEAWHHRSDAASSAMAFIGISIAVLMGEGYESADDWAAIGAAFVILFNSYLIFRPALGELMDEHLYDDVIQEIKENATDVEGIIDTEKCFVRKAGMQYQVDLHAIVDGNITVQEGHKISHDLKDHLQATIPHLRYILIHIEPHDLDQLKENLSL